MKKKAQVIKLIINKPGAAIYHCSNTRDFFITQGTDADIPYHLYILSDEEIKEGDWYVWLGNKQICQAIGYRETDMYGLNAHVKANDVVKIIATTELLQMKPDTVVTEQYVPQIPESFLPIYVKAYNEGNPITEVELECKGTMSWDIKLTDNNEVVIHLPEEKMYSRDEVKAFAKKYAERCQAPIQAGDKWIEENL